MSRRSTACSRPLQSSDSRGDLPSARVGVQLYTQSHGPPWVSSVMANVFRAKSNRRGARALRRRTSAIIVITAFSLIAALVFAAVSAEGREISRASSNDGGAWLINRELSVVGHKNRSAGELSTFIRILESPDADVHQFGDLVVVHDEVTGRLIEVDTRSFNEDLEPTVLPERTQVHAIDQAVVFTRSEPLTVWKVPAVELSTLQNLDTVSELHEGSGAGSVAVRTDGTVVVLDHETMLATWYFANGTVSAPVATQIDPDRDVLDVSIVDDTLAVLLDGGDLAVVGTEALADYIVHRELATDLAPMVLLQQPSGTMSVDQDAPAMKIVGVTAIGELVALEIDQTQTRLMLRGALGGTNPLAPIAHGECVYGVVTEPAVLGISCDEFVSQELNGAGSELRLRLVNGWVWVNDLTDGGTWVTNDTLRIEALEDWGRAAPTQQPDPEPLEDDGGDASAAQDTVIIENPDALGEVQDSDDYDPTEANTPPIAVDDSARTRVDRSIVVDVLANDTDLNNDILIVSDVRLTAGDALVTPTASLQEVQVTPGPGFLGTIQFNYQVSDGRSDPVTASVVIDVLSTEQANRAPVATTDVVATAPGNATTIDVLRNDIDPDGDALALVFISADVGTLRWDPSGQVTYTPDTTTSSGWIELPYLVADDLGAESEGQLRVEIRDLGANQEPDARNDQAATVVGRPVALELLLNDSDPDGDPLIVSSRPRLLSPEGVDVRTSTTPDGEFIFEADVAGTYLFEYSINDGAEGGSESDTARIRIDVAPAEDNEPPVAVRDDVVISIGDTRTVYVLDNDGDPDGDVISIVDWSASPGLLIAEFNDGTGHVGFQITATPTARRPTFSYSISDGTNEPVSAAVVVSLVGQGTLDQPPFAIDDIIEVRAGSTVPAVDVLSNDFDPEGGSLRIVRTGDTDQAQVMIGADAQNLAITVPSGAISSFSVPYDIEDEGGNRAAAVLRVQLISEDAPNRPPTARADEARTSESVPIRIDVLRNDSDPDADAIALEGVSDQPEHGTVIVTPDGVLQYNPDPLFTGTDIFRYSIVDAVGDRALGEVFVGVMDQLGTNLPPIANDDSYTLAGTPTTTPLEVRANDFDPEGDPLRVVDVTPATVGSVAIDLFGRVEYIPPIRLAVATVVTFDYVISDTAGNRARATVSIELEAYEQSAQPTPPPVVEAEPTPEPTPTPDPLVPAPTPEPTPTPEPEVENEPPVAVNDERGPVQIGTTVRVRVLDNDFDPDGESGELSVVSVSEGARIEGSLVIIDDIRETTQLDYTIADADGAESSAVVTVLVIENQAPVVAALETETAYETALTLDLSGRASDVDGDELFFICCEDRRNGEVSEVATGPNAFTLVFTPASGFVGQAAFSYRVDDQQGHQTSGVVTVNVLPPGNRGPVVVDNSVQVPQGATVSVDLALLARDPDGDPLTWRLESTPSSDVEVSIDGPVALVTTTRDLAVGPAGTFTYSVSDGVLSDTGAITIEVVPGANEPPEVLSTSLELPAASGTTVDLAPLTIDEDLGDSVTWELVATAHDPLQVQLFSGLLQIQAPASAVDAEVAIAFIATDTRGETGQGTVNVLVTGPVEPEPVAINDEHVANRGETSLISPLINDVDPLGQGLTLVSVETSWGTASVAENQVRFAPGDRVGAATIRYTMRDAALRESSANIVVDAVGVPEQPSPPGVSADSRQVTIEWTNPAANGREITGYRIASSTGEVRTVPVQNSFVWDELVNGDEYTFTVTAINAIGESPESDPSLPATPNQVPETPAPPTVVFGDRQLTVSWTPPANEGSNITGYELEIGPSPAVEQIGTNTEFVWQGLTNGQDYTFRVRAQNAGGFSNFSAMSSPEHPAAPPEAPTIAQTIRGSQSGSLTVNWFPPVDNGDEIIEYQVRSSEGVSIKVPGADTSSFDWANLPNGTEISFEVRARNRAGWSRWSESSIGVPPCGLPGPATKVVATRGDGQVGITWDAAPDNGCAITSYTISTTAGAVQNSATPGHTFTGLVNGTAYAFEIRATNERGAGTASATSNSVVPAGPPLCPTGTNMTANVTAARAVDLSWSPVIDNGSPITQYTIGTDTTDIETGSTATNRVVGGLANGTQYSFSYFATNDVGNSPSCGSATATTWALPTSLAVSLSFDPETDELTADATGGRSLDGATELGYTFTLDGGGGNPSNTSVNVPTGSAHNRSQAFTILEDGLYDVTVEGCNAAGCVDVTETLQIVLAAPPEMMGASEIVMSADTLVRLGGTGPFGTSAFVDLFEPVDNGAPIIEYEWVAERYFGSNDGDAVEVGSGTEAAASGGGTYFRIDFLGGHSSFFDSVNNGESVTWRVMARAINSEGAGEWSDWHDVTPTTPSPVLSGIERRICPGDDSCVELTVTGYGFEPDESYRYSAFFAQSAGGRDARCDRVDTTSTGAIDQIIECNFQGSADAPFTYRLWLEGVESSTVS